MRIDKAGSAALQNPQVSGPRRPVRKVNVASLRAIFEHRSDGRIYAQSVETLQKYPPRLTDSLKAWARESPQRTFLAQRGPDGAWQTINYAEAWMRVRCLAGGLLKQGLSYDRPL